MYVDGTAARFAQEVLYYGAALRKAYGRSGDTVRGLIHNQICWTAVINVLDIISEGVFLKKAVLPPDAEPQVRSLLFPGARLPLTRPGEIQADCVVGIFRYTAEGPVQVERQHQMQLEAALAGPLSTDDRQATHVALLASVRRQQELARHGAAANTVLSHVLLSVEPSGVCIGTNNGCIGGRGDWSRSDLAALLHWDATGAANPSYRDALNPAAPAWAAERIVRATPVRDLLQGLV